MDVIALVAAALGLATLVFLGLWLWERSRRIRLRDTRQESEWDRIDRELDLAEQAGRFRIVGDLGDVAIQSVSRLVTQAEAVRYAADADPAASLRSAGVLETSARDALADLRRLQAVAREAQDASLPQPSLHSARDLFRVMRDAGLAVTFRETGERFDLRAGAELAVFRILQTSLENALKHGGAGTNAAVAFSWTPDGLQVSVEDDGIRAAARRLGLDREGVDQATAYGVADDVRALTEHYEGAGIIEMRERASLFGGTLNAQTVAGIGFTLSAVFPALRHHNGVHGVDLRR
ncbi:MAG: sensor histidine kinase [Leifsonia sp.]